MTAPGEPRLTRPIRVVFAAIVIALLQLTGDVIHWIEAAYPLRGGIMGAAMAYVAFSVVVTFLAAVTLGSWIIPGWIVARLLSPDDPPAVRAIRASVIAFAVQPAVAAVVLWIRGGDTDPVAHGQALVVAQSVLLLGSALAPISGSRPAVTTPRSRQLTLLVGLLAFGLTLVLLPHLAWTDYNPDGIELLTLGRSLSAYVVPRIWNGELPSTDLGMITSAYPVGWLVAIGGTGELTARLPVISYGVGIALAVLAIAELRARRVLQTSELAVLLLGAAAVVLTIALNSAYNPYSTDVASPASIDLLAMFFFLATLYFVFAGGAVWVMLSALLFAFTRPTALILFVLLAGALLLVERDWRSPRLRYAGLAAAIALFAAILHGLAVEATLDEGVLSRVRYLRFDDWMRLRFLVVPSGVLPVLSWIMWRKLDSSQRALALVACGYFAFFYVNAFYSLHHFAPAMLLPLVTYWRGAAQLEGGTSIRWRLATALGVALALALAFPRDFKVFRETRRITSTMSYEMGNYSGDVLGIREAFEGWRAVGLMFETPWIPDPSSARITEPYSYIHYAALNSTSTESAQYVIRPSSLPPPPGTSLQGSQSGASLYVRDLDQWRRDRADAPDLAPRSRFYDVPRTSLLAPLGVAAGIVQIDLLNVAMKARGLLPGGTR